jgi:hypothetical protein
VRYPKWLFDSKLEFFNAIRMPEFAAQIKDYLATTEPEHPKTIRPIPSPGRERMALAPIESLDLIQA